MAGRDRREPGRRWRSGEPGGQEGVGFRGAKTPSGTRKATHLGFKVPITRASGFEMTSLGRRGSGTGWHTNLNLAN